MTAPTRGGAATVAARRWDAVRPPLLLGWAAWVLERNVLAYRRMWVAFATGFVEPVLYLFSIGIGLGGLVRMVTTDAGASVPYAQFVAPALLASSAMNGAVFDSTYNVFFKLRYAKTYDAMLATPLTPRNVAVGEIAWCLVRGGVYSALFLIVGAATGVVTTWRSVLALPAAVLIAWAFAAVGMFATSFLRTFADFDLILLVVQPLFLFSATFFPLSVYPDALHGVVQATPLYHGVALVRSIILGESGFGWVGHVAYLLVMGALGLYGTSRRLTRLLLT